MLRKEFIGLSILSFFGLLTKKVFGDTIEIPKMATTLKRYLFCSGKKMAFSFSLEPYIAHNNIASCALVSALPTGFTALTDSNGFLYGLIVDRDTASHIVHEIEFQVVHVDSTELDFILEFDLESVCTIEQEVCCREDSTTIRWLGREGGIKQWTFTGVKTFDVRIGEANRFKNNSLQAQYSQRSNIYYGKVITSGNITKVQADFLDELKYSIQAWEVVDDTSVLPILINNESFDKYKSTQKFYDVSLAYIAAEEVRVQTQ